MQTTIELFNTDEAAKYLGLKPTTLRNSRNTGILTGVDAPLYRKMGSIVRYDKAALDTWLAQFAEQNCTSQIA